VQLADRVNRKIFRPPVAQSRTRVPFGGYHLAEGLHRVIHFHRYGKKNELLQRPAWRLG
jgi:hypothetical protein